MGWREEFSYKSLKIQLPDQLAFHTAGLQMPTSPLTSRRADKRLSGRQKAVHQGSVQVPVTPGDWTCSSTVRVTITGGRVEGEVFLCLSPAYCERLNWLSLSKTEDREPSVHPSCFFTLTEMDIPFRGTCRWGKHLCLLESLSMACHF